MYFKSRVEAGNMLAEKLTKLRDEDTAVVALNDGGVIVGAQIASHLHCVLTMFLTEPISVPGEPDQVATLNQDGGFTYNNKYSEGQLEELASEYHGYIEQQKMEKMHTMNRLLGKGGLIRRDLLRSHNVVLVSDGLPTGNPLESAADFLKPIKIKRLIIATPLASVAAVDRMHLLGDEICCLSVAENFMYVDHYYEDNTMPDHEAIANTIKSIVKNWHTEK